MALPKPLGDRERMLNREDFVAAGGGSGVGDDGRSDFRRAAGGGLAAGGELGRIGGASRIVGVGPDRIELRIVYWPSPREGRRRSRRKLLAEASESLSYVGGITIGLAIAL